MANKKNSASETLKPVPEIPASVMDHIYYVADTMIGKSNLVEADRCDLIQEMSIAVCRAKTLLDANGKSATGSAYLNKAVDLTAKNIYRQRIRKHNDTPCLPIEDCLRDEEKEKSTVITPMIDDSDKKSCTWTFGSWWRVSRMTSGGFANLSWTATPSSKSEKSSVFPMPPSAFGA